MVGVWRVLFGRLNDFLALAYYCFAYGGTILSSNSIVIDYYFRAMTRKFSGYCVHGNLEVEVHQCTRNMSDPLRAAYNYGASLKAGDFSFTQYGLTLKFRSSRQQPPLFV